MKAVAPKPINIVMMRPGLSFAELADLGVRRISIGGALARVMWASAIAAARELKEGRFDVLGSGILAPVWTRCFAPSPTHKCTGRTTGDSVMSLVNL